MASPLDVVEEGTNEGGVQVIEDKLCGNLVELLLGKLQEKAEGVAIRGNGVGTCPALLHQPLGEKRLE
jgi:hypothetical protein